MEQVTLHNNFTAFWNKKIKVTYILSVLVCILHVYAYKNYTFGDDLISKINSVFVFALRDVLPPVAVPLFFIISGYAFFRNFTIKKYPQKLKSRIRTLLIPYLIWNTIWMLFQFAVSYSPVSQYFVGRAKLELNVLNVFLSIFHWKANGPFWFIFNLMVFMIASPLIYYLMKNRYVGIISIIALIILLQFDFGIPESIFLEKDSIIYFMFGNYYYRKQFSKYLKLYLKKSDKRMGITTETFNNLKVIKLYGWDNFFLRKIQLSRNEEIDALKQAWDDSEKDITNLEAQRSNVQLALDAINSCMKYIFFSEDRLRIEYEDGVYKLVSHGKSVKPRDVSVGERNIIGLSYFFTRVMEGKDEKDAYNQEYLLIIDDPVKVAKTVSENNKSVLEHRTLFHDSYSYNWSLNIPYELKVANDITHEFMASLNLSKNQAPQALALSVAMLKNKALTL